MAVSSLLLTNKSMNCRQCGAEGVDGSKTTVCRKCHAKYQAKCEGFNDLIHEAIIKDTA